MITRQGWLLLIAGAAALALGRLFGLIELYVLAAGAAALVVLALVYVRSSRLRLRITRSLTPSRVHAGDVARIELAAANIGRPHTPVLKLRDPVAGTRGALLHLAPLRSRTEARAAYRLPTTRRGLLEVGPLTVEVADPFGLTRRTVVGAPLLELTVYPHVDRIVIPRTGGDRNPDGLVTNPNALGRQGEEFYALREYVVGDDIRRVHWPSSAGRDELLVRQDETPFQDRTTVLLDLRRAAHSEPSLERAVSAAASVLTAATRANHLVRLITTDATDSGTSTGFAHNEALLEFLARVETTGRGSLRAVLETLARTPIGGVLVTVLGRATTGELDALARLRRSFRQVIVVATDGPMPAVAARPTQITLVDATADATFASRWARIVASDRMEVPA